MKTRLLDLLERTVWTFVQTALAAWIVLPQIDLFSVDALKVAGMAGVIAAAKCVIAFQVGSSNTAATLPELQDTNLGGEAGAISVVEVLLIVLLVLVVLLILGVV